jgi:hypothetical protein
MNPDDRRKQKRDAKTMYLDGVPLDKIVERTGVMRETLEYWIYKDERWKDLFDEQTKHMVEFVYGKNKRVISRISEVGTTLIYNSLVQRAQERDGQGRPVPLSIKEARSVTEIITAFDKLRRLDAGDPTDITEGRHQYAPLTIEELTKAIQKDQFIDLIPLKRGVDFNVEKENDRKPNDSTRTSAGDSSGSEARVSRDHDNAADDVPGPGQDHRGSDQSSRDPRTTEEGREQSSRGPIRDPFLPGEDPGA